ncbi:MAG TPA: biotin/lipoyl-binding protein, partial [Methylomirabilota bacterium]|nr:biotin/lipoyl-binding protein [Methylomirabilota bacterium]
MRVFGAALRWWRGIVVVALILAGVLLGYQAFRNNQAAPRALSVTGTIEATQVEVTPKYTGRIVTLPVQEGAQVQKGHLLAALDDMELQAEVSRLQAALRTAQAQLRDLLAGARKEEVEEAKASVERARAQLDDLMAG